MNHSYQKSARRCVLVDVDRLSAFVNATQLPADELSISLDCRDSITRNYNNLDAIRSLPNLRNEAITSLTLQIGPIYCDGSCKLTFRSGWISDNVVCEVRSSDEAVLRRCRDAFESYLERNSPWWSILGSTDYASWKAIVIFIAISVMLMWHFHDSPWASFFLFTPLLGFLLSVLMPCIFHRSSFLIGAGEPRFHRAETWRVIVFVGFLISLLASVVASTFFQE